MEADWSLVGQVEGLHTNSPSKESCTEINKRLVNLDVESLGVLSLV